MTTRDSGSNNSLGCLTGIWTQQCHTVSADEMSEHPWWTVERGIQKFREMGFIMFKPLSNPLTLTPFTKALKIHQFSNRGETRILERLHSGCSLPLWFTSQSGGLPYQLTIEVLARFMSWFIKPINPPLGLFPSYRIQSWAEHIQ